MKLRVCGASPRRADRVEGGLLAKPLEARRQTVPRRREERQLKTPGAEGITDQKDESH